MVEPHGGWDTGTTKLQRSIHQQRLNSREKLISVVAKVDQAGAEAAAHTGQLNWNGCFPSVVESHRASKEADFVLPNQALQQRTRTSCIAELSRYEQNNKK